MSFAAAGLNCIAVGPTKLYIYKTTDTITSASVKTNFNTVNCPGMLAGDIVLVAHNTSAELSFVRITEIDDTSCTYVERTDLT